MKLKEAKMKAAEMGLIVANEYDKRFINTWLYTIGQDVKPILRTSIIHKPKGKKKSFSWSELASLAEA